MNLRSLLPLSLSLLLSFPLSLLSAEHTLWIGTGGGKAKGIYRATFDSDAGKLSEPVLAAEIDKPGFVTLNADKTRLYCVSGDEGGSVAAFSISPDGTLALLNKQPIGDGGAAHLTLDRAEKLLFTAQYSGGSVAVFPLNDDGSIAPRSALVEHSGTGPNASRQEAPHPHWVGTSPDNRFLLVPDLGIDRVVVYEIDHSAATLRKHGEGVANPGSGPRHLKFNPDGTRIYLLNELDMTVTVFAYDAAAGTMEAIQTIEALPEEMWEIPNKSSEIRIHPSGRFVYAANRGHDSIAVFSVDPASGQLAFVEREAIRGAYPRNFNIDPTGQWLLAGGRASNTISIFKIDPETGGLLFTTRVIDAPSPICLEF